MKTSLSPFILFSRGGKREKGENCATRLYLSDLKKEEKERRRGAKYLWP